MNTLAVLNVVGLTPALIPHLPSLAPMVARGGVRPVRTILPAVTCSVQATYLTGARPSEHGIVGNGWYDRDDCEVKFWKQSDRLVQWPRLWQVARQRHAGFTCANLFWWYAMYCGADLTVTPRPMYPADGRKLPDLWTNPPQLREQLQRELGSFPLFQFWGPMACISSTQWIAQAAVRVDELHNPTLLLVYLPHLDYCLQRRGPDPSAIAGELREIDGVLASLIGHCQRRGREVIVLSEYGIESVNQPVHLNRALRERGFVTIREELGRELLDPGASAAFAVADHQIAHVYVNDPSRINELKELIEATPGVDRVLAGEARQAAGLAHPRAGDLVAIASPGAWFTYYYWLDDHRSPDFARTVDIHRKPGYDPVELFLDPAKRLLKPRIAWKLLRRRLGFRTLLDVIPLDASLVRGSHGREPSSDNAGPVVCSSKPQLLPPSVAATDMMNLILHHLQ